MRRVLATARQGMAERQAPAPAVPCLLAAVRVEIEALLSMGLAHSPMAAPENGARYWLAGLSAAGAATMTVYCSASAASRAERVRTMLDCFWPTAT